jgi:hypothetical protein
MAGRAARNGVLQRRPQLASADASRFRTADRRGKSRILVRPSFKTSNRERDGIVGGFVVARF